MKYDYNELPEVIKDLLKVNESDINPLKILLLAEYLDVDFDKEEACSEFAKNLNIDPYNDCSITMSNDPDIEYIIHDTESLNQAFEYAREDVVDDLRSRTPKEIRDYVDWEQCGEDAVSDIWDLYPDSIVNVEQFCELENNPFDIESMFLTLIEC